jgi:hypothetical protein
MNEKNTRTALDSTPVDIQEARDDNGCDDAEEEDDNEDEDHLRIMERVRHVTTGMQAEVETATVDRTNEQELCPCTGVRKNVLRHFPKRIFFSSFCIHRLYKQETGPVGTCQTYVPISGGWSD